MILASWVSDALRGFPGTFIPLFLLAVFVIVAAGWQTSALRRRVLRDWAKEHALSFRAARTDALQREYPEFDCLKQGDRRYARNLIRGRWDERDVLVFDYHCVTGRGGGRRTHRFSAVIVDAGAALQPLLIRPEKTLDKMSAFFGADDVRLAWGDFDTHFRVRAPNPQWARDVLSRDAVEFLLARPPFAIQLGGRGIICYRDRRFAAADFQAACEVACGLLDRLPDYANVRRPGREKSPAAGGPNA